MNERPDPNPGVLTAPIDIYVHPNTGTRVDLVGMIHLGTPDYYNTVQTYVDNRTTQGALVHYESLTPPTEQERASISPSIWVKALALRGLQRAARNFIPTRHLGLVEQTEALTYRHSWENHDASALDLLSRMSLSQLCVAGLVGAVVGLGSRLRSKSAQAYSAFSALKRNEYNQVPEMGLMKGISRDILDYRNQVALAAVDRQHNWDWRNSRRPRDLVLPWGAGHLPGLGAGLEARGFVKAVQHRVPVMHLVY